MPRLALRMLTGLSLAAVAWLVVDGVAPAAEGLVMFAPGLLLAWTLLTGRYVGEHAIERVRAARTRAPEHVAVGAEPVLRLPRRAAHTPRGGLLLAASLATRPPPALS